MQRLSFSHQLMSHRGGSLEHMENTLAAFRHTAKYQFDLMELDVQLTRDEKVVICHDNNLLKLCNINVNINDLDYNDLPPLVSKLNQESTNDNSRIPLLNDLFTEFPRYPMQIDVKNGPELLIIKTGLLIKQFKRENLTVWGSFRTDINNMCFKHFGNQIPLFYPISNALFSLACWSVGCFWIYRKFANRYSCLIFPNVSYFMWKGWFKSLNKMGVSVILFGVPGGGINDIRGFEDAKKSGANGICTDRPTLLKEWLESNSLNKV